MRRRTGLARRHPFGAYALSKRRKREQDLQISEVRYRRLFEAAHDGILIFDAVTTKILEVNPFVANLLGYPKEYFLGKELWEIGVFKDTEVAKRAMASLQRLGQIRYKDTANRAALPTIHGSCRLCRNLWTGSRRRFRRPIWLLTGHRSKKAATSSPRRRDANFDRCTAEDRRIQRIERASCCWGVREMKESLASSVATLLVLAVGLRRNKHGSKVPFQVLPDRVTNTSPHLKSECDALST